MLFRYTGLVMMLLLAACGSPSGGQTPLSSVAPFASLSGVSLGMRADALHGLRPAATFAAYAGYQEIIDGDRVIYWFDPSAETSIDPALPLLRVTSARTIADSQQVSATWQEMTRKASDLLGKPQGCWTDSSRYGVTVEGISWEKDGKAVDAILSRPKAPELVVPAARDTARVGMMVRHVGRDETGHIPTPCG